MGPKDELMTGHDCFSKLARDGGKAGLHKGNPLSDFHILLYPWPTVVAPLVFLMLMSSMNVTNVSFEKCNLEMTLLMSKDWIGESRY